MQTTVIDEAAKVHPNSWWWLKADGCNLVSGLSESTRSDWSGDVDLNDGKLAELREVYQKRLDFTDTIGLIPRRNRADMSNDLTCCSEHLSDDIKFLTQSKCHSVLFLFVI